MAKEAIKYFKFMMSLGVAGGSLGWMLGISSSPVLGTFVASILTIICSGLALLTIKKSSNSSDTFLSFAPVAIFLFSCAVFSTSGVWIRNHGYLTPHEIRNSSMQAGLFSERVEEAECFSLLSAHDQSTREKRIRGAENLTQGQRSALIQASNEVVEYERVLSKICGR